MKQRVFALLLVVALFAVPAAVTSANPGNIFDVKFSGVIQAVPTAPGWSWTIAGFTVQTDDATQVTLQGVTEAKVGMWADVTAQHAGTNVFKALRIAVLAAPTTTPPTDPSGEVSVYGPIQAFSATSWTVAGVTMAVTPNTTIMGTPQVGLLARAVAIRTTAGLEAKLLKVTWLEPKRGYGPAQFKGVIEAMPQGLIGIWTISGRQIEVTDATNVQQKKGDAVVGANVHVVTAPPPKSDGEVAQATLIQVLDESGSMKPADKGKPSVTGKPDSRGKPEVSQSKKPVKPAPAGVANGKAKVRGNSGNSGKGPNK